MSLPRHFLREMNAEGWWKTVTAAEVTAVDGEARLVPAVLYSVTLTSIGGDAASVKLADASSTADATPIVFIGSVDGSGSTHFEFPKGIIFDKGIIMSATATAGGVSLTKVSHPGQA